MHGYTPGGGGSGLTPRQIEILQEAAGQLWVPPATPDARDDEFDAEALDAAWDVSPAASASAIDPYANFSSGGPRFNFTNRASWMLVQPDGNEALISKAVTVPTNFFVWAELSFSLSTGIVNGDSNIALVLSATSGGNIDTNNMAQLFLNEADAGIAQAEYSSVIGGSGGAISTTGNVGREGQAIRYVALHKLDETIHAWAFTDTNRIYLLSDNYPGVSFDRIGFRAINSSTSSPGNNIFGANFIRCVESAIFFPS